MAEQSSTRTPQASRFSERGQTVFRKYLTEQFAVEILAAAIRPPFHDVLTVGVPATMMNCAFFRFPQGMNGRILRFGLDFLVNLAGNTADGTVLLDRYLPAGVGWVNIGTIVLPATAAGVGVIGSPPIADVTIAIAGGVPPYAYVGGELLVAYVSGARTGVGPAGQFLSFIDFTIDATAADATAAVLAYLLAL